MARAPRGVYRGATLSGKLRLVDLAGSERAAETQNAGQKLRDGANINRQGLLGVWGVGGLGV